MVVANEFKSKSDDAVNLYDVWQIFLANKKNIILITSFFSLVAGMYVLLATPVYQSKAYLLPPDHIMIQELNRTAKELNVGKEYLPEEVYKGVRERLVSKENLKNFFQQHHLSKLLDEQLESMVKGSDEYALRYSKAEERFLDSLVVLDSKKTVSGLLEVKLSLPVQPERVAELLSDYISETISSEKSKYAEIVENMLSLRISKLHLDIKLAKEYASVIKSDRLVQLEESIAIAHALNIEKPSQVGPAVTIKGVTNQGLPLYYLGFNLLEAERDALKARKDEEPFISGLRDIQKEIEEIKSFAFNVDKAGVAKVDQAASIPKIIKPRRVLVVILSIVLGLIFSVIYVLLRIWVVRSYRGEGKKDPNASIVVGTYR